MALFSKKALRHSWADLHTDVRDFHIFAFLVVGANFDYNSLYMRRNWFLRDGFQKL